jgi:phage shock protein C
MNTQIPRRLVRLPAQGRIAGVCAGIAAYLDADVTVVRLAWVILAIVPGAFIGGAVAYIAACLIMPVSQEAGVADGRKRLTRSTTDRKIAGVCSGLAEYFDIDPTVVRLAWAMLTIWPGAIVLGVVAYLVAWFIVPAGSAGSVANAKLATTA